jgi:hypothetical protein
MVVAVVFKHAEISPFLRWCCRRLLAAFYRG